MRERQINGLKYKRKSQKEGQMEKGHYEHRKGCMEERAEIESRKGEKFNQVKATAAHRLPGLLNYI